MKWSRTSAPEGGRWTNIETVYTSGPWTVTKEFYADGPSLFEWVLENSEDRWVREPHRTARQAKAKAAKLVDEKFVSESGRNPS